MHDPLPLFKCLADASRLKILAGLLKEPMYVELIAQRLALSPSTVSFHLKKMEAVGLVTAKKEQYYTVYSADESLFSCSLGDLLAEGDSEQPLEEQREAEYRQKVIDNFFVYGKLKIIPAQRKKRQIILAEIAAKFRPGIRYPEREVNLIISEVHDDFCTLRRELIIEKLLTRDHCIYWVTGTLAPETGDA